MRPTPLAARDDRQLADVRRRLLMAGGAVLLLLAFGTLGYRLLVPGGDHTLLDDLYMTVITLTTVGYGEIIPLDHHPAGRVFTMVLLLFGMGVLVYFASTVTAFFVEGQLGLVFWRKRMQRAIAGLRDHYIVAGERAVAGHVIDELRRVQRPVVAVVPVGATLPQLADPGEALWIEGDPADEAVLAAAGIAHAAGLVAAMESDRDNVLVTLTARQANPALRIVAMEGDERNEQKLRRAGADAVVRPYLIGGLRIASELIRPGVVTFLDQMLRDRDQNLRIDEIRMAAGSAGVGRTIGALHIEEQPGVLLIALVEDDGATYRFKPAPSQTVGPGATLIVMGGPEALAELRGRLGGRPAAATASRGPGAPPA